MKTLVSTKDYAEKQDDEAERLVRPAPKVKPPRHDRRRERVEEEDPDLESRVAARFAKEERVPAKNKQTGDTVMVSPRTLQEESGKYEALDPEDAPGEGPSERSQDLPKAKKPKKTKQPASQEGPSSEAPTPTDAEVSPPQEKTPSKKSKPSKEENRTPSSEESTEKPPTVAEKAGIEPPDRDPPSLADRKASTLLLADTFPPKLAAQFIAADLHPQDIQTLVGSYKAMSSRRVGNPLEYADKVAGFYETSLDAVKPPKSWKTAEGVVPFDSLPGPEKALAYRQHQMQVVATSLAAQTRLQETLVGRTAAGNPTVPKDVAAALAITLLKAPKRAKALKSAQSKLDRLTAEGASPEDLKLAQRKVNDLQRAAKEQADNVFEKVASGGPALSVSPAAAKKLLNSVSKDPAATQMARAYLEANDYKLAKQKYLASGSLSEFSPPHELVSSLKDARTFFSDKSSSYGGSKHQGGLYFEAKVLEKLRSLDSQKYKQVQSSLAKIDTQAHSSAKGAYDQILAVWSALPEDQRGPKPEPPVEPLSSVASKSPQDLRIEAKGLLGDLATRSKSKIATTVSSRYVISTYLRGMAMARTFSDPKVALYHGVDPQENYPTGAYRGWGQAHQRDLGESDYEIILGSAKTWLKSPVLSLNVGGMVPDQRFRAALDLAIHTSAYNRQIDVRTYNDLLARLQGVPVPGLDHPGLPTKQASDRKTKETAIFRKFPADSKMKRGGKLIVMLTGDTARVLRKDSYDLVPLEDLSDSELDKLLEVFKIKMAANQSYPMERITVSFEGEGVVSSGLATDLETTNFFYRDATGATHEDGFMDVTDADGATFSVSIPKGAKSEAFQAIINVAKKHALVPRVASSSINTLQGGNSLNYNSPEDQQEKVMKLSSDQKKQANTMITRLDKMALDIQANAEKWGIPFKFAKALVNGIDKTADELEVIAFGPESLHRRQAELAFEDPALAKAAKAAVGEEVYAKAAAVLQRDSDESYMDTFKNPMKPIETDADEPYMSAYSDDQSEAVGQGTSTSGRDLAPTY